MNNSKTRCHAFTASGERCKNIANSESGYCHVHKESYLEVEGFFQRNSETIKGYIWGIATGVTTDKILMLESIFIERLFSERSNRQAHLSHQRFDYSIRDPNLPNNINLMHQVFPRYFPISPRVHLFQIGPAPLPNRGDEVGYYELEYLSSEDEPERPIVVELVYDGTSYNMGRIRDGLVRVVDDKQTGRSVLRVHQIHRTNVTVDVIFFDDFYRNGRLVEQGPATY